MIAHFDQKRYIDLKILYIMSNLHPPKKSYIYCSHRSVHLTVQINTHRSDTSLTYLAHIVRCVRSLRSVISFSRYIRPYGLMALRPLCGLASCAGLGHKPGPTARCVTTSCKIKSTTRYVTGEKKIYPALVLFDGLRPWPQVA